MKRHNRLDDVGCDIKNAFTAHLGAFVLSNSKRIMSNFVRGTNGFYNNNVKYTDTDSPYKESK